MQHWLHTPCSLSKQLAHTSFPHMWQVNMAPGFPHMLQRPSKSTILTHLPNETSFFFNSSNGIFVTTSGISSLSASCIARGSTAPG